MITQRQYLNARLKAHAEEATSLVRSYATRVTRAPDVAFAKLVITEVLLSMVVKHVKDP